MIKDANIERLQAMDRAETLRKEIIRLNNLYHATGASDTSDAMYDAMKDELAGLEAEIGSSPDSPLFQVGAAEPVNSGFAKVKHARKMLSLAKTTMANGILDFFVTCPAHALLAEWKIDGLSLDLTYVKGQLTCAVTRGDGTTGDDVTVNVKTIKTVPTTLPSPFSGHIRGEVYMSHEALERLNAELGEDEAFANCRNAAAGSLKQHDVTEVARRELQFTAYWSDQDDLNLVDIRRMLAAWGFSVLGAKTAYVDLVNPQLAETVAAFTAERADLPFDVDGIVFKIADAKTRADLGEGSTSPKWAVAYKFPPETKTTLLQDICLTVGKSGQITPNAVLAPVSIAGATVRAASICNQDEIERLGLVIGAEVVVTRANDVIPKILRATNPSKDFWKMPEVCPSCGSKLVRDGVHYFCPNHAGCPEQVYGRLQHAVGKSCLDLDGCGEAAVRTLISQGCRRLSDVLAISPSQVTVLGDAASSRFLAGREVVKKAPFWRKLAALGIEGVGRTASKDLAAKYSDILAIAAAPQTELEALMGPVKTSNLLTWLRDNADEIERLDQLGMKFVNEQSGGKLSGKTFVITGSLLSGTRDQIAEKIEKAGGTVKGSVSKKVDFLVVGSDPGTNKLTSADKCGTLKISEEELYALLGVEMTIVSGEEREF